MANQGSGSQGPKRATLGASPLAQVSIFWRGQGVRFTKNFSLDEFECKCGKCGYTLVDQDHVARLQDLRDRLSVKHGREVKLTINSAYRCPNHNRLVGGANDSQHLLGTATDITASGVTVEELHAEVLAIFDGVGIYDDFIHADSRGFEARWDYRSLEKKKGDA